MPADAVGDRSGIKDIMIPAFVAEMVIKKVRSDLHQGLSVAHSEYRCFTKEATHAAYRWQCYSGIYCNTLPRL